MYGITESECLRLCGIHNNFFTNLRKGTLKSPSFENIYAIAKFFGVSIDQLALYNPDNEAPGITYNEKRDYRVFYNAYRRLDADGKRTVNECMIREWERTKKDKKK